MSDSDLEAKFHALTDGVLSGNRTTQVIDPCRRLNGLEDAGELARATVPD